VLKSLSGNLSQDRVVDGLGDFLIAYNLALSRAQEAEELKVRMAELEEELSLKTKTFANRKGQSMLKFFLLVFAKDEAQAQSPSPGPRRPKPKKPKSKA